MGLEGEEHTVVSQGGYLLTLHRILSPTSSTSSKGPVFIMHGFLGSSEVWLFKSRAKNLATVLSDDGYDVWLGNRRGNTYSHQHQSLRSTADSFQYWDFSFDETGHHDLPSMINYILNTTNQQSLIYIGHSLATTEFLVAASTKPYINSRIKVAILLAPVAFPDRETPTSPILKFIISQAHSIARYLYRKHIYEFLPQDKFLMRVIQERCSPKREQKLCVTFLNLLLFSGANSWDKEEFAYISSHFTYGSSVKMFVHIGQLLSQGSKLQMFDYGVRGNTIRYGTSLPPRYNITRVLAPVALIHSKNDPFLDHKTVGMLGKYLPNVILDHTVSDPKFKHMDYMYSSNVRKLIVDQVLDILSKYQIT